MHTATQLNESMFEVSAGGSASTRDVVFPEWNANDRFGIVVHEPFGALGATHLIQMAITAFYDCRPERRAAVGAEDEDENPRAIYPEIYLLHVGDRFGDHSNLDFWPARKEVFLPAESLTVLDAINDRAITRLAVPDEFAEDVAHEWKEPACARDRVVSAFAYSATGRTQDSDLAISGVRPGTEANVKMILDPEIGLNRVAKQISARTEASHVDDGRRRWETRLISRMDECRDYRELARSRRDAISADGLATETYRRITVDDALARLVPEAAI